MQQTTIVIVLLFCQHFFPHHFKPTMGNKKSTITKTSDVEIQVSAQLNSTSAKEQQINI